MKTVTQLRETVTGDNVQNTTINSIAESEDEELVDVEIPGLDAEFMKMLT